METTLNRLRSRNACTTRYAHLLAALGGPSFDHDAPINLLLILEHNGVADTEWVLSESATTTDCAPLLAENQRQIASLWAEYDRQIAPLRAEYQRQQAPLEAEYDRQCAPLRAEYDRQCAPLWAENLRQQAPLLAEYDRQQVPLWAEYDRQCAPLWAEYQRQIAPLLAEYERQRAPLLRELLGPAGKEREWIARIEAEIAEGGAAFMVGAVFGWIVGLILCLAAWGFLDFVTRPAHTEPTKWPNHSTWQAGGGLWEAFAGAPELPVGTLAPPVDHANGVGLPYIEDFMRSVNMTVKKTAVLLPVLTKVLRGIHGDGPKLRAAVLMAWVGAAGVLGWTPAMVTRVQREIAK